MVPGQVASRDMVLCLFYIRSWLGCNHNLFHVACSNIIQAYQSFHRNTVVPFNDLILNFWGDARGRRQRIDVLISFRTDSEAPSVS